MDNPFIGTIARVGFNFAPLGWLPCDGRLLSISEYDTLYALIGTTYGGDGQSTFGLPDLRGRVPIGQGQGPGLQNYTLGQSLGSEQVSLTLDQLPSHGHTAVLAASASDANSNTPSATNSYSLSTISDGNPANIFTNPGNGTTMGATIGSAGGSQPHENRMPFTTINYIIATEGLWPSQS